MGSFCCPKTVRESREGWCVLLRNPERHRLTSLFVIRVRAAPGCDGKEPPSPRQPALSPFEGGLTSALREPRPGHPAARLAARGTPPPPAPTSPLTLLDNSRLGRSSESPQDLGGLSMCGGSWVLQGKVWAGKWPRHLHFLTFPRDSTIRQRQGPHGCATAPRGSPSLGIPTLMGTPDVFPGDSATGADEEPPRRTTAGAPGCSGSTRRLATLFPEGVGVLGTAREERLFSRRSRLRPVTREQQTESQ